MFDIFFGWGKASKCKKLIRRVQCRLKLLKNKRCAILHQSRDDVAQLLRLGCEQSAYNRVEQIIKDEHILQVYDLLEAFCEFVVINLPYIRKHRDCPEDINEAVSTLVFAAARCGDLPELRKLQTLFSERYGQKFTKMAVELLPGNLVNLTIKENLTIKSVSNDDRYKLMDEIASSLHSEPLALEYTSEWQQQLETPSSEYHSLAKIQESQSNECEIVLDDDICNGCEESDIQASDDSMEEDNAEADKSPLEPKYNEQPFLSERHMERSILEDSASESSSDRKPEEIIYLDDIEEFKYPIRKDDIDQRVFVFISYGLPSSCSKVTATQDKELLYVPEAAHEEEMCIDHHLNKHTSYLRTISLPPERPIDNHTDNLFRRSKSFPFQQQTDHISNPYRLPHVHPKLPDYDELAKQFMALKKAALQKQQLGQKQ